ncbi:hypothetical protein K7432_003000 [Basidiobolus ranarum]|uniref:BZIP domain-containing protein n=1 Tax=Basidiobolus ranarum TaxID=34480 RepID=A0ABR2X0N3_9FUNG
MTEQLSSNQSSYYFSQSTPDYPEDKPIMDHSPIPDTQHRRVASRRRKHHVSSIEDPTPSHTQPPLLPHDSQLPLFLPPPVTTSFSLPLTDASSISSPKPDQTSSPMDSLSFSGHSTHIHLPSPDMLTQLPPPAPPQHPPFLSMTNMTSSLPSAPPTALSLPIPASSSVLPIVPIPGPSSSPGPEVGNELHSSNQPGSPTEETSSTRGRSGMLRNLTSDERKQRRLLRNRLAAKECRKKKKAYVTELEEKVQRLEDENSRLKKEVEKLGAKLSSIT